MTAPEGSRMLYRRDVGNWSVGEGLGVGDLCACVCVGTVLFGLGDGGSDEEIEFCGTGLDSSSEKRHESVESHSCERAICAMGSARTGSQM